MIKLSLAKSERLRPPGQRQLARAEPVSTPSFARGAAPSIRTLKVGVEATSLILIDGLLANPSAAIDHVLDEVSFVRGPQDGSYFPGVRGRGSAAYLTTLLEVAMPVARDIYGLSPSVTFHGNTMFSLTTTAPGNLRSRQKVPHVDMQGMRMLSVVHYLFDRPLGGTGFYRHRSTGYETISEERADRYERILGDELERHAEPRGYIVSDNELFEQIYDVEPALDRLVLFPGHLLHSGTVCADHGLSDNPRSGRLTANTFIALA